MNIKDLRISTGMTQTEFGDYLNIPMRTIQNWEGGQRNCPEYVIELIKYKIEKEILNMDEIKYLSDYTLTDVTRLVNLAMLKAKNNWRTYIHLDDIYSDNPTAHLTTRDSHGGGGRVIWGYVMDNHNVYARITKDTEEYYDKDRYIIMLYEYIRERY